MSFGRWCCTPGFNLDHVSARNVEQPFTAASAAGFAVHFLLGLRTDGINGPLQRRPLRNTSDTALMVMPAHTYSSRCIILDGCHTHTLPPKTHTVQVSKCI